MTSWKIQSSHIQNIKMALTIQVIVAPLHPGVDTFTSRLNDDNQDYSGRKQYHQTKTEAMQPDFD